MFQFLPRALRPQTIRRKLQWGFTAAIVLVLLLTFALMLLQQQRLIRSEWSTALQAQAQLIATNSQAAMTFGDTQEAERLLWSSEGNAAILRARVLIAPYTPGKPPYAEFARTPDIREHASPPPPPQGSGIEFHDEEDHDHLLVWAAIPHADPPATVELLASLQPMRQSIQRTTRETGLTLLAVLLLFLWVSHRAARRIARPLLRLNQLMGKVADNPALTERANAQGHDELAQLGRSLNDMIERLQKRNQELQQYRENLETLVEHRTQALQHATAEAQAASRAKSDFLARMSHEIRTPMNAILGLLELLQRTELTDRQRDYAVKTNGAARSLLGLLNDILDFSKVEAGKMTLENEPIQIDKLLRNISTILSANVGSKDIEVLFDIDSTLPAIVCGDAMRLQQVLINLGGNAVKFTSQGQVVLAIHKLSQSDNSVTIRFAVKDTGIGIAPEHQAHIFSGFSQAESSTTRKFGGTGLGLAISKRLVELMGGDIEITSTPGVGSTFAFEIELATVDTVSDAPLDSDSPVIQRQRVLVVDDNTVSGELTVGMIRSWGWTADLAKSGKQALEMVAHQEGSVGAPFPYPVIYMGWKMPDMDGWEVTLRIREIARVGNMPQPLVFMLSARGREALALRTEEEQDMINGFLVKPVTASMLFDVLAKASGGKTSVRKRSQGRSRTRQLVGMRILVVEDNLINQQVADELLTAHGAIVSLAANGQLGVDAVAAAAPQYDVVLMDIQMPVLDGYGATQAIRNELGLLDLPIVAMTANAMARDRDACIAAGMNDHIGKPFDIGKLVSLLIRITGLRPSQTTAEETASGPTEVHHLPEIAGLELQTAMNRMSGMRSLYVRTSREFVRVMDTVIPELQQCLADADMRKAKMRLHTLKGNAGTLGATELAAHAAKLEKLFSTDAGVQECEEALVGFEILVRSTQNMLSEAIAALEPQAPNTGSVAANTPGQPVSAAAIAALRRIVQLSLASNLEVLQEFDQAKGLLSVLPAEEVDALNLLLQCLDLEMAATLCEKILTRIDHPAHHRRD